MSVPFSKTGRVSPAFLPILQQLETNSVLYFGKPLSRVEPTLELHGRYSRVLRLRIEAGDRTLSIFVKRYEPRTGTAEEALRFRRYVVTEYSRTLLAAQCSTPSTGVARAIACLPDHFALVTEEAQGVGLDRLFKRCAIVRTPSARENVCRALRQAARWLRAFQAGVPVVKTRMRDYRNYLDIRLRELVGLRRPGFGEAERAAALSFFDIHHPRLTPADRALVPIHGDLCPTNILVRDQGVTVLDLGMSGDGTRYQDLAHLCFHVELSGYRLSLGSNVVERLKRALLEEFEPGLTADAPLFRIMLLQHAVCFLAQLARQEPDAVTILNEWQWRRRVAWCIKMTGVAAATGGWLTGARRRTSGSADDGTVLGEPAAQCVPRGIE